MHRSLLAVLSLAASMASGEAPAAQVAFELNGDPSGYFSVSDPIPLNGTVNAGSFEGHWGSALFGYSRGNSFTYYYYFLTDPNDPNPLVIDQQSPPNSAAITFESGMPVGISYLESHDYCHVYPGYGYCGSAPAIAMSGNVADMIWGTSAYTATITFLIPEPATSSMLLAGLGLLGLSFAMRREPRSRKKRSR